MDGDNRSMRFICALLFVLIAVLTLKVSPYTVTWVIPDRILIILSIGAAYSVWKSDYWGPRIGIWASFLSMAYAAIELLLIYRLDLAHYSLLAPAMFLNTPLIIMAVVTGFICVRLYRVEKIKYHRDVEQRRTGSPGKYGNCPNCGFDQIKFIDGVDYKCTRCGKRY